MSRIKLFHGDNIEVMDGLPARSVQCVITSPPYYDQRDYQAAGQIGKGQTEDEYITALVATFAAVRRVLHHTGIAWLNIGDKMKGKSLLGMPWRVALALKADGWFLRSEVIWNKPNGYPESVTDRPTRTHEQIFMLTKRPHYYYDAAAISEPKAAATVADNRTNADGARRDRGFVGQASNGGTNLGGAGGRRNKRSVWSVTTQSYKGAHFATYPPTLVVPCVLASTRPGDTVLDPFNGAGSTGVAAIEHLRDYIGIDINADYLAISRARLDAIPSLLRAERD